MLQTRVPMIATIRKLPDQSKIMCTRAVYNNQIHISIHEGVDIDALTELSTPSVDIILRVLEEALCRGRDYDTLMVMTFLGCHCTPEISRSIRALLEEHEARLLQTQPSALIQTKQGKVILLHVLGNYGNNFFAMTGDGAPVEPDSPVVNEVHSTADEKRERAVNEEPHHAPGWAQRAPETTEEALTMVGEMKEEVATDEELSHVPE